VNTVTASFNTITGQITEMPQEKKKILSTERRAMTCLWVQWNVR